MPYVIPPAGVWPLGLWTAPVFVDASRPPAFLADRIDPRSGELLSVFSGAHPVDAAVLHQIRVRRASGPAVEDDGTNLGKIRKNTSTAPAEARFELERALRELVERGDIRIEAIDIEAGEAAGDTGAGRLRYTNLRTGRTLTPELP